MNKEQSMPVPQALRTLTLGLDLAVFLWRRYRPLAQPSVPVTDAPPVEPLDHKRVVSASENNDTEDGGSQALSRRTKTVNFGLDGQNYVIDLSDQSTAEPRETPGRYIAAGRRVGRQTRTSNIAPARPQPATGNRQPATGRSRRARRRRRQWARAHGHQISDRGPISATVRQAYTARRRGRAG